MASYQFIITCTRPLDCVRSRLQCDLQYWVLACLLSCVCVSS